MTTLTTTVKRPLGLSRDSAVSARGPASSAGGSALTATDILRVLQQRMFLVILVTILGSAISVGVTILTKRYFPLWTAAALIRVESPRPENPFDPWGRAVDRDTIERNLADQSNLIRDPSLLREALSSPEIRNETTWFQQFNDDVDAALQDLDEKLVSSPVRGTSLLRVAMGTRNPKDAPIIVNKLVELYMGKVMQWSRTQFSEEAKTFQAEVVTRENELEAVDDDIERLEREGRIPGMLHGAPTITVRLRELQAELVQRESELELLRARYDSYRNLSPEDVQASPELAQRVENDPKVANLSRHIQDLSERKNVLALRFGPDHLEMRQLDTQLAAAEKELAAIRLTLLNDQREALMESYRIAYYSALQAVADLKESVAEATQEQLDLDERLQKHRQLQLKRDKLEAERDRYADAHANYLMVARAKDPVRIDIVREASTPLEPSRPRPLMWIALGIAISLTAAVALALALSLLDTSMKTPRDIIRHANLPLLGTVPVLDDEEATVEDIETAVRVAPHSLVAECFRQIRANLLFSAPLEQQRSILITSASPDEGKTCVAINLAVTLAKGGRKILLMDANFRRPALHKAFGARNHRGLSHLLIGQGALGECTSQTDLPNLDVLTAGPCPPNPAELLSSNYLRELLAEAVENYDQVLIDAPPVLLVSDALVLSAIADGTILVCRARTGRGLVQRAKTQLGLVNSRIVGAVLNAVETTRGGYFRKYYREFYDYQEPEELEESEGERVGALPFTEEPAEKGEDAFQQLATDEPRLDDFAPPEIDEHGLDPDIFEGFEEASEDEDKPSGKPDDAEPGEDSKDS